MAGLRALNWVSTALFVTAIGFLAIGLVLSSMDRGAWPALLIGGSASLGWHLLNGWIRQQELVADRDAVPAET